MSTEPSNLTVRHSEAPSSITDTLRAILRIAHAHSTGSSHQDPFREIRDLASETLLGVGSPTPEEVARFYQQACLQSRKALGDIHKLCVRAAALGTDSVPIEAINAASGTVPALTSRPDDPWNYADAAAVSAIQAAGPSVEGLAQQAFRLIGQIPATGTGGELRHLIGMLAEAVPALVEQCSKAEADAAELRALLAMHPGSNGADGNGLAWIEKVASALSSHAAETESSAHPSRPSTPIPIPSEMDMPRLDMDAVARLALEGLGGRPGRSA